MRRIRTSRSSASTLPRLVCGLLSALLVVSGLMLVGAPGAVAAYDGPKPIFDLRTNPDGTAQVQGYGWSEDAGVTVSRNGTVLGIATVSGSQFSFTLYDTPAPGDAFLLTGLQTLYSKDIQVTNLAVTNFGLTAGTVAGTKGASPGWGDLDVWLGNMWKGVYVQDIVPADGSTGFTHTLSQPYDRMHGTGLSLNQADNDGDHLIVSYSVPQPSVQFAPSSISLFGWVPWSSVTVYLDDDTTGAYPYSYEVQVNGNGDTNCCAPPPDEAWQFLLPGYRVKAVGAYPGVDGGTAVKELIFPEQADAPIPTTAGNVVSGTVTGTLGPTTVGQGSLVQIHAACGNGGDAWRAMDAEGGSYSVDFGEATQQPEGERTCADPLFQYNQQLYDLNGDSVDLPWFVDSMFDATHPALEVETPINPESDFFVNGTGWDLGLVDLQLCEMVAGDVGECDDDTFHRTSSHPVGAWPADMAGFEEYLLPSPTLFVGPGNREVDCSAPGSCAVLATETLRPEVRVWAPLEYATPVQLDVEIAAKGTVNTVSGNATITGSVTASAPGEVHVFGEVRQRFGRTRVVVGEFDTWVYVGEAGAPATWEAVAVPWTGQAFGSGFAEVKAWTDLGENGYTEGDYDVQTVKLSAVRVRR
jgi:hypothetical protein